MDCYERHGSRRFTVDARSPSGSIGYVVTGTTDAAAVQYAVLLESPGTFGGLRRQRISPEHQGGELWHATVDYALVERTEGADGGGEQTGDAPPAAAPTPPDDVEPLGPEYSFDASGETVHLTQSLFTAGSYAPAGATPPDYKGAIGVSRDGVEGCDVYAPKLEWTATYKFTGLTRKYIRTVMDLTGTVNAGTFRGWGAEQVLFLGATGQGGQDGSWSVTYKFAVRRNRSNVILGASDTDVTATASRTAASTSLVVPTAAAAGVAVGWWAVGTGIPAGTTVAGLPDPEHVTLSAAATSTGIDRVTFSPGQFVIPFVRGWQHLWVAYGRSADQNQLIQVPTAAYVEQVYETGDFSKLGIGQ